MRNENELMPLFINFKNGASYQTALAFHQFLISPKNAYSAKWKTRTDQWEHAIHIL